MVERIKFNSKEKAILDLLFKKDIPLSPYSIAKETGLSYITVNKYLPELFKMQILVEAFEKNGKVEFVKFVKKGEPSKYKGKIKRYTLNPEIFG